MPRDFKVYLEDILEAVQNIEDYIRDLSLEQFKTSNLHAHAVLHNFYIIGEAVRNIPDEIRGKYSHIDWRRINALRNLIAHVYFGIDLERIWLLAKDYTPQLRLDIETILKDLTDSPPEQQA